MKKFISIVLTIIMSIGLFTNVYAKDVQVSDIVKSLKEKGVKVFATEGKLKIENIEVLETEIKFKNVEYDTGKTDIVFKYTKDEISYTAPKLKEDATDAEKQAFYEKELTAANIIFNFIYQLSQLKGYAEDVSRLYMTAVLDNNTEFPTGITKNEVEMSYNGTYTPPEGEEYTMESNVSYYDSFSINIKSFEIPKEYIDAFDNTNPDVIVLPTEDTVQVEKNPPTGIKLPYVLFIILSIGLLIIRRNKYFKNI